jgi:hypothetical protein
VPPLVPSTFARALPACLACCGDRVALTRTQLVLPVLAGWCRVRPTLLGPSL